MQQNRTEFFKSPMLRVDPEQRCAVVLVYDKYLGVIPFRRSPDIISTSLTTSDTLIKSSKMIPITVPLNSITQHELFSGVGLLAINRPPPNLPSYVTFLNNLNGVRVNYILDMQFLNGYYEPTLLILYEPIGTYVGYELRSVIAGLNCYSMKTSINKERYVLHDNLVIEPTKTHESNNMALRKPTLRLFPSSARPETDWWNCHSLYKHSHLSQPKSTILWNCA